MRLLAGILFLFFGTSKLYSLLPTPYRNFTSLILMIVVIVAISVVILKGNERRKEEHFLEELSQHYKQCKGCTVHNPQCPVALEINQLTEDYLGEEIPFVGDIIRHIESTKEIDEDKYYKLMQEYYEMQNE